MPAKPLTIEAVIKDKKVTLNVEEYHPFEPSAYVWDSGWLCWTENAEGNDTLWYYVSESGEVYIDGTDTHVGVAPAVKEMADAQI